MNVKSLKILSTSDNHLGHPRVSGEVMRENFIKYVYPKIKGIDIFFIVGDFFHTLLNMDGKAAFWSAVIISEIKAICKENNVFLRVLRGTFTHDRQQNQFFVADEETMLSQDRQTKVFDEITIEYLETLGIHILYVPDDLPYEDAFPVIEKVIRDHGLSKVDIALTHTYYDHLIPDNIPHRPNNTFNAEKFGKLVSGVILNGHVHTTAIRGKVITNGSLERMNHGEEEDKGFYLVDLVKRENEWNFTYNFVVNEGSTIFKTIDVVGYSTEDSLTIFTTQLKEILNVYTSTDKVINLRIVTSDTVTYDALSAYVRTNYSNVNLDKKKVSSDLDYTQDLQTYTTELPIITPANISGMLKEHIFKTSNLSLSEEYITSMMRP